MKLISLFKVVVILFVFLSCSNSATDTVEPSPNTPESITIAMQSGEWKITKMIDSEEDKTTSFQSFIFTFQTGGSLLATNGNTTYNGTWNITDNSSSDDSSQDVDFTIFFNLTNDFEDLNDDWDVSSTSNSKLELIDISGGNGGTDYLTFEKN